MKLGVTGGVIAVLLFAAVVVGYSSLFSVYQTQQALVVRLGQPVRVVNEPGLHAKAPFIDNVITIDRRILDLEAPAQEVIASDQKRLVVDAFARYKIKGANKALDTMEKQLRDYAEWEKNAVLPAARTDFRMPPELYAFRLKQVGIDIPPEQLISRARRGFYEIRQQMDALAPQVAAKNGWAESDYPSVLAHLREKQIPQDQMEARYAEVLGQIQQIAARELGVDPGWSR